MEVEHAEIELQYNNIVFEALKITSYSFSAEIDMDSCLAALGQDTMHVANVQPNYYIQSENTNAVPNDPLFSSQYAYDIIDAKEAWDITVGGQTVHGDQIVVAVLDDGFDLNHADLNFWKNLNEIPDNGVDDDGNGYTDDRDGWNAVNESGDLAIAQHGTHVSVRYSPFAGQI